MIKNKYTQKIILKIARLILILFILAFAILFWRQEDLLFFPSQAPFNNCKIDQLTTVQKYKKDLLRYYRIKIDRPKGYLIHFHGNGGRACDWAFDFEKYTSIGIEPIFVEYPGYAEEDSSPSVSKIKEMVELLKKEIENNQWQPLFIHGISMGTGPAILLAGQFVKVNALILDHPYTSLADLAYFHYSIPFAGLILKDDFESHLLAKDIYTPVLVHQGTRDQVIPPKMVEQQMSHFPGKVKYKLYKGLGHDNTSTHPLYWAHTQKFIQKYLNVNDP